MTPWYFRGRTERLGWFGQLSWLGRLNYYVLQWSGYRLAAVVEGDDDKVVGWTVINQRPLRGWLR